MNKKEFLHNLEKELIVLKESEREDILTEYSQHIDEEIIRGVNEEEAVEQFGNIKMLAIEILDAYRIDSNEKAEELSKKNFVDKTKENILKINSYVTSLIESLPSGKNALEKILLYILYSVIWGLIITGMIFIYIGLGFILESLLGGVGVLILVSLIIAGTIGILYIGYKVTKYVFRVCPKNIHSYTNRNEKNETSLNNKYLKRQMDFKEDGDFKDSFLDEKKSKAKTNILQNKINEYRISSNDIFEKESKQNIQPKIENIRLKAKIEEEKRKIKIQKRNNIKLYKERSKREKELRKQEERRIFLEKLALDEKINAREVKLPKTNRKVKKVREMKERSFMRIMSLFIFKLVFVWIWLSFLLCSLLIALILGIIIKLYFDGIDILGLLLIISGLLLMFINTTAICQKVMKVK